MLENSNPRAMEKKEKEKGVGEKIRYYKISRTGWRDERRKCQLFRLYPVIPGDLQDSGQLSRPQDWF